MSLFRAILKYVWPQMRKFKFAFYTLLLLFAFRTLFEAILRPLYFKKIVDILSSSGVNHIDSSHDLLNLVWIVIFISILATFSARLGKFIFFKFEINVIRELRNFCFKKIQGNSQTFFANTFSGSLVNKSKRFVSSFEAMFDIFIYNFLSTTITLVGVFFVLGKESLII
jgi:ATP-binding cassette subfamily B protein